MGTILRTLQLVGYPDLERDIFFQNLQFFLGAHLSSQAFLLLRRPVVSVQINLTSSLTEIDTTKPQGLPESFFF